MAGKFEHITYDVPVNVFKERYKKIKSMHGGMSLVLLAKDMKYKRKVVVKMFDPNQGDDFAVMQELAERFDLEAEISAQLNHPNTVRVYEQGQIAGRYPFITMEYIDGQDLHDALSFARKNKLFSLEEFLLMFYQMCEPIKIAHEKNIINRDLKPKNILLSKYGDLKVCDWGIAKILQKEQGEQNEQVSLLDIDAEVRTAEGVVMGTPSNFPPEIIRGHPADERTDIYLLTSILYEAVTGHPPFSVEPTDYYRRMRDDDHEFDKSKLFIPGIRQIIELGMQTEQENRYQTVAELQTDVLTFMNQLLRSGQTPEEHASSITQRIFRLVKKPAQIEERGPARMILSDVVKKWARKSMNDELIGALEDAETINYQQSRRSKRRDRSKRSNKNKRSGRSKRG